MDLRVQKKRFYQQVSPSKPNEWEVDATFERLAEMEPVSLDALLNYVPAIWPVSHSLCFAYLSEGVHALRLFPLNLLDEWVRGILGLYERKGLVGAREFMAGVDKFFLGPKRGEAGVHLADISSTMLLYIQGVSDLHLKIEAGTLPSTDTRVIYLPSYLDLFPEKEKNLLFFKMLVTLQWGQIVSRIYTDISDRGTAVQLFSAYPDRQLTIDLLAVLQFIKVYRFIAKKLPGIIHRGGNLCRRLIREIQPTSDVSRRSLAR